MFRFLLIGVPPMLVLRPNVAAIDRKSALAVDADEGTGSCDLGGIVGHWPVVESGQLRLDLAQPLVYVVRQFVSVVVFGLESGVFGIQGVDGGQLVSGEVGWHALQLAHSVGGAVGEVDGDVDPLPALARDSL